ncbi:thiamine-phosphate kinase [Allorhodopirellula heiligendammensis]|uniref:Thiamine-monophosphate kinase n=1 Tax=Allorhodopirellula heiligendammensis TaxID=2714739 RepID=A0A5C6C657_9BACT|nr:thiamine-phosphate kinase [Allorhodopirellula heiligendammensis]TWU19507.1 Thiamine-monophosphate kinase [Allorhodopirellula heiligendammensis]
MNHAKPTVETLSDWGEFRLLNEIILPVLRAGSGGASLGDDCAFIESDRTASHLVVTTDVGPKPLVWSIGHCSYWTWGWYSVLANASDLAAAGATPVGFTTSVEAPGDMTVADFRDYFEGMDAACKEFGLKNAGGNIRVAPRFACHGTAFGSISDSRRITRNECKAGDTIVAIGKCGYFIACYLKAQRLGSIESLDSEEVAALLKPRPRIREMEILQSTGVLSAATDNSDGVLGSLWNIAERSGISVDVCLESGQMPDYVTKESLHHGLDPRHLFLFWGDWQVIASVKADRMKEFERIAERESIEWSVIGKANKGPPGLFGVEENQRREIRLLRNENFVSHSFNENPMSHTDYLLRTPLYIDS